MSKPIIPPIHDPALRHLLRQVRRALLMICATIAEVAPEEETPRKAA